MHRICVCVFVGHVCKCDFAHTFFFCPSVWFLTVQCLYNAVLCFLTSPVHVVFDDVMGNMHVYSNSIKDGSQTIHKVVNHTIFRFLLAIVLDVILLDFLYNLSWASPYFSRFAFIH